MAHDVYILGVGRAGFRIPKVGGGYARVKKGLATNVQVDLDDHRTQLLLSSERNFSNFIRVAASGSTTATICGLSRRGFRIPRQSDGAYVQVVVGGYLHDGTLTSGPVTVDLTNPVVCRILYRSKRDWFFAADPTALAVYGIMNEQNGFDLQLGFDATAELKNVSSTNVSAGDTVTVNDQTYRFETSPSASNDVLIGPSILASLQNLANQVNGVGDTAAIAVLTEGSANVTAGDTVVIHNITYRFESSMTQANDVKIGATADATLGSLIKAVNQTGIVGTDYFTGTSAPTGVTAGVLVGTGTGATVTFTATTDGLSGNSFASTTTSSHLSWGHTTFTGGSGGQPPTNVKAEPILTLDGDDEIYQVTFHATVAGTAANSYASTETSSQLYFGATTFGGGAASSGDSDNGVPTKIFRGQSVTVDATKAFNYQQLRRHYDRWIEA